MGADVRRDPDLDLHPDPDPDLDPDLDPDPDPDLDLDPDPVPPDADYISPVAPVRVLLVGADPLARGGLAALLSRRDDVAVVGEGGPDEAEAGAEAADVLLWDLGHGSEAGGPEALARATALAPVVALAEEEAAGADAARAGARGVLLRGAGADALAAALVAAARGLAVLDGALGASWLRPPEASPAEGLTAREREVLALLVEGLANKAIAARLDISEHTAKFHVNSILAKLGAGSRAEAVVRAIRLGLVAL